METNNTPTKTGLIAYYKHPVLFKSFILLPADLQNTFIYRAKDGCLIGLMNNHRKEIKWLEDCRGESVDFIQNREELKGGWDCMDFSVNFYTNFGLAEIRMDARGI